MAAQDLRSGGWKVPLSNGDEVTLTTDHVTIISGWISQGHAVDTMTVGEAVVVITQKS